MRAVRAPISQDHCADQREPSERSFSPRLIAGLITAWHTPRLNAGARGADTSGVKDAREWSVVEWLIAVIAIAATALLGYLLAPRLLSSF
jgi:hypothetical protein